MKRTKKRMIVDIALTVMLVFEMLYQLTGNALHEYVGLAFFICIGIHLFLSRTWIVDTRALRGARNLVGRRKALTVVACLLAADIVLLGASSIVISSTLWNLGLDLSFMNPGGIWAPIHAAASYGLCAIVAAHLAMHWTFFAKQMRFDYNPTRRRAISQAVNVVAGVGAVTLGVNGFAAVGRILAEQHSFEAALASENSSARSTTQGTDTESQPSSAESPTSEAEANDRPYAPETKNADSSNGGKHKKRKQRNTSADGASGQTQQHAETDAGQQQGDASARQSTTDQGTESTPSEPSAPTDIGEAAPSATPSDPIAQEDSSGPGFDSTTVCTLCRKRCSFSNLKCDKPYAAGLV